MNCWSTRGFTLIEILISIMIFSIISVAMVGVLLGATNVYRAGESARVAHDSTATVLAQLSDDLQRMVPAADGGYFFCRVYPGSLAEMGGSMVVSFTIVAPDTSALFAGGTGSGSGARQVVSYRVDHNRDVLMRVVAPSSTTDGNPATNSEFDITQASITGGEILISGCLHFSVDLSLPQSDRASPLWQSSTAPGGLLEPSDVTNDYRYTTENTPAALNGTVPRLMPDALRINLVLAGSTRANQAVVRTGSIVREEASGGLRYTGVKQVPLGGRAIARLKDANGNLEWIRYDNAANGVLSFAGARPSTVLRSVALADPVRSEITFGNLYHLVAALPR